MGELFSAEGAEDSEDKQNVSRVVPTKDQVYVIADAAILRDRAIVLTLWQSGLRNSTLRNLTTGHVKRGLLNNEVPSILHITPDIDRRRTR